MTNTYEHWNKHLNLNIIDKNIHYVKLMYLHSTRELQTKLKQFSKVQKKAKKGEKNSLGHKETLFKSF